VFVAVDLDRKINVADMRSLTELNTDTCSTATRGESQAIRVLASDAEIAVELQIIWTSPI
jgi:hypothetical protein